MLHKLLKRFRVSEVHLCLPFFQITLESVKEEEIAETESSAVSTTQIPVAPTSAMARPISLSVQERPALPASPSISVSPLGDSLYTELAFRIAHEVDSFGPLFPAEWRPLSSGLDLHPGDYLWLRLYCRNHSDRVAHKVRIAMEGIEIAQKQCGILIRGVNGWPRIPLRDVTTGHEIPHINPGEDYSLHCVLRVPTTIPKGKRPQFTALKPEFNILKQLN